LAVETMTYRLSRQADDDLRHIYVTGVEIFGVARAEAYAAGLKRVLGFLADFPRAARERRELDPPVRAYPYKSHLIIYAIEHGGVLINRIVHSRQDWMNETRRIP